METFTVTATQLKNNTSTILEEVYAKGKKAEVIRHGKIIVEIKPVESTENIHTRRKAILDKTFGSIPDLKRPKRYSRKKDLTW